MAANNHDDVLKKGGKVGKAENRSVFCPKRLVETEMYPFDACYNESLGKTRRRLQSG